jgi:hypothetical protein
VKYLASTNQTPKSFPIGRIATLARRAGGLAEKNRKKGYH